MQAKLKRIEVESLRRGDHDFTVDDAAVGQVLEKDVVELRKVTIERTKIAALDEDFSPTFEDDRAEAVPLRLEKKAALTRDGLGDPGEHWLDRRLDGESTHDSPIVPRVRLTPADALCKQTWGRGDLPCHSTMVWWVCGRFGPHSIPKGSVYV